MFSICNLTREYNTTHFSFGEITSALESLQNGKATGADNIAAEALKVPALRHLILSFMNRALAEGATPELWRTLIIVPVPKKGRSVHLCQLQRHILDVHSCKVIW